MLSYRTILASYEYTECHTTTCMCIIARILAETPCEISLSSYPHALNRAAETTRTKKGKQHLNVKAQSQTLRVDLFCIIVTLILEMQQVPSNLHP